MTRKDLPINTAEESLLDLRENGFCVINDMLAARELGVISAAYDRAVANASAEDTHTGRSSTRVEGLLKADPVFSRLYEFEIFLAASRQVLGGPSKLSCFHARSLHPHCEVGEFHMDFRADEQPFPLLSFIYMIDGFSEKNGATRFLKGSHHHMNAPTDEEFRAQSLSACGPAGSVVLFDGRVWHAHGANSSSFARRSIQGSFIPLWQKSATELAIPIFDPH